METTIKLMQGNNQLSKYFYVYEVTTVWKDGKKHVSGRYLNEEKAEETAKMWREMEHIETAFVIKELVFV